MHQHPTIRQYDTKPISRCWVQTPKHCPLLLSVDVHVQQSTPDGVLSGCTKSIWLEEHDAYLNQQNPYKSNQTNLRTPMHARYPPHTFRTNKYTGRCPGRVQCAPEHAKPRMRVASRGDVSVFIGFRPKSGRYKGTVHTDFIRL